MAKYNIYAVKHGIDPDTKEPVSGLKCKTWDECKKYINGVADAKYKGFLTDNEADAWLGHAVINEITDTVEYKSVDKNFVAVCQSLGLSPKETESAIKQTFIDIAMLLKDKNCLK